MIKPLSDRIVVHLTEAEAKSPGGIVLPDTAKEKPREGKVVAVGPGRISDDGELLPMDVKVGDVVVFADYSGTEIDLHGKKYTVLRQPDVLAIVA
jgi:chaperonin GroES